MSKFSLLLWGLLPSLLTGIAALDATLDCSDKESTLWLQMLKVFDIKQAKKTNA